MTCCSSRTVSEGSWLSGTSHTVYKVETATAVGRGWAAGEVRGAPLLSKDLSRPVSALSRRSSDLFRLVGGVLNGAQRRLKRACAKHNCDKLTSVLRLRTAAGRAALL